MAGNEPLHIVTHHLYSLWPDSELRNTEEMFELFDAAARLNLQLCVENSVSGEGDVSLHVYVMSGAVDASSTDAVWPAAPGATVLERMAVEFNDTDRVFEDPRWTTHKARATWAWIMDGEGNGAAILIADFLDEGVARDTTD